MKKTSLLAPNHPSEFRPMTCYQSLGNVATPESGNYEAPALMIKRPRDITHLRCPRPHSLSTLFDTMLMPKAALLNQKNSNLALPSEVSEAHRSDVFTRPRVFHPVVW